MVVSAYFSHLHSHPLFGKLGEHREKLQSVSEAEGLMLELEGRVHQFRGMLDWNYDDPRILELRMEDVTVDAATYLPQIFDFLGLGPEQGLDAKLLAARHRVTRLRFTRRTSPGEEDVTNHYRKGVAGDWVNHFGPEHIEYFKAHYNDLLLLLGYETLGGLGLTPHQPRVAMITTSRFATATGRCGRVMRTARPSGARARRDRRRSPGRRARDRRVRRGTADRADGSRPAAEPRPARSRTTHD